jgi:hypothetical protein
MFVKHVAPRKNIIQTYHLSKGEMKTINISVEMLLSLLEMPYLLHYLIGNLTLGSELLTHCTYELIS